MPQQTIMALGITFALAMHAVPSSAQVCQETSYIPSINPFVMQHANGTTVALLETNQNYQRMVAVWINNVFYGVHPIPLELFDGMVRVRFKQQYRNEIWMGQVRQVLKITPYVLACGDWTGDFR